MGNPTLLLTKYLSYVVFSSKEGWGNNLLLVWFTRRVSFKFKPFTFCTLVTFDVTFNVNYFSWFVYNFYSRFLSRLNLLVLEMCQS